MKINTAIRVALCGALLIPSAHVWAKGDSKKAAPPKRGTTLAQKEVFNIVILETDKPEAVKNPASPGTRSFGSALWEAMRKSYSGNVTGLIASTSADILSSAVGLVVESLSDKKPRWYQQAQRDCKYTKTIPMTQEAHDFYAEQSSKGALDPENILFDGFGCTQYYTYNDSTGAERKVPVMTLLCKLRRDSVGVGRLYNHGKFEVVIDKFYLNPLLCNLPNDSLTADKADLRTPFDFERRKNLTISLNAKLSSSWVNEAIQVTDNKQLGEFDITVTIPNENALVDEGDYKGWYVYDVNDKALSSRAIAARAIPVVKGESFVVPRSFIGTADGNKYERIWGTGQYKIDMVLTEKCDVNLDFYYDGEPEEQMAMGGPMPGHRFGPAKGQRWNHYWSEEWNKMKKRKGSKGFWRSIAQNVMMNYANGRWVYTLTQPVIDFVLVEEAKFINPKINALFGLDSAPVAAGAPTQSSAAVGGAPAGQGQGGNKGQ